MIDKIPSVFELIVVVIIIVNIVNGYMRGFINTMIPIVSFLISLVCVKLFVKPVAELLVPIFDGNKLLSAGTSVVTKGIIDSVSNTANNMFVYWVTYAILFSVIYAICNFALHKLNLITAIPIIKPINQMLGGAIGVAISAVEIWVSYLIVNILVNAGFVNFSRIIVFFNQSTIYRYVNTFNPIIN